MLPAQQFGGSHTGDAVCDTINHMLDSWELRDRIHLVVGDNVANMVKGLVCLI